MPSASPIIVIMLTMKNERSNALPTTAVAPTAAVIDTSRHEQRDASRDERAEHDNRITSATEMPMRLARAARVSSPSALNTACRRLFAEGQELEALAVPRSRAWRRGPRQSHPGSGRLA